MIRQTYLVVKPYLMRSELGAKYKGKIQGPDYPVDVPKKYITRKAHTTKKGRAYFRYRDAKTGRFIKSEPSRKKYAQQTEDLGEEIDKIKDRFVMTLWRKGDRGKRRGGKGPTGRPDLKDKVKATDETGKEIILEGS